ncbi:RNA polymerase sigma factor [Teredinibacter purpureus]|uniref:RNA polymerase sigma factor n=1 Tax=Teredinibacter purpureus TaxID=2731756 RepID=UPI0005F7CBA6|nr:RNA polymerase sigma factor [Teredinibacter purpureus]
MTRKSDTPDTLIKAAQSGDSAAFESLLQLHYDRMYRFACKWCGNPTDAQDITQQACLKLARSLGQFRFDASFTTWLYRLVVTCAIDWHRSETKHTEPGGDGRRHVTETTREPSVEAQHDSGIYLQQILSRLESWGEGFKATLLLVLAEGLTHAEAANVLAVKESTISWRLHQIRKKLNLLSPTEGGTHE